MPGNYSEDNADSVKPSRWPLAAAWGLVLIALWIRSYGLSHDFDIGKVYHPDTPKQVYAAQRFAHGQFYSELGSGYDGYPLFSSLMAAGIYQAVGFVADISRAQLGLQVDREPVPDTVMLEWIMRGMNVVLSSLSVWVLFLLARRMSGPGSALLAAAFLCLSPLDVAACHHASGDSASAFFALVSLFFSVRILQRGGTLDYVLAAAACMCSFSAKYHGALTAVSLIAAHILRAGSFKELFGLASIRRAVLVLLVVAAVFFLTNPATLVRTNKGIDQVSEFLASASQFGQSEAMRAMNPVSRWFYSAGLNLPVFAGFMSPVLLVFALAGVGLAFFTDKTRRVVAVLPIAYVLLGLSRKTAGNPVYSTLVTPALFLLAVVAISELMRLRVLRPLPRIAAWAAVAVSGAILANGAYREMFFFGNRDTRVLAENWVRENIPSSFQVRGDRYTFLSEDLVDREAPFTGEVVVRISGKSSVGADCVSLGTFWMEEKSLSLFRNFPTELYAQSPLIRENWKLPVYQKIPSMFDTDSIMADSFDFFRSVRLFRVSPGKPEEKTLFSRRGLEDVVVRVQCGSLPARVEVTVGGQTRRWWLEPDEVQWAVLKDLRRRLPLLKDMKAYRIRAASEGGPVQVGLALDAEEKGMMLFTAGAYREAVPFLRETLEKRRSPTTDAMAQIGLALGESGQQAAPLDKPAILAPGAGGKIGAEDILGFYQVALPYLDDLACLQWEAGQLKYEGFRIVQPAVGGARELWPGETSNSVRVIRSPLVMLDRGCYSARVLYRLGREAESPVTVTAKVLDASGCQVAPEQTLSLAPDSSGAFRCLDVSFAKPAQPVSVRLVLEIPAAADVGFRSMAIRPDVAAGVDSLAHLLDAVVYGDDPHAASSPANFDLLMTMGRKLAREGVAARGAEFFLAAAESCPARVAPAEALAGLVPALDPGSVSPAMAAIVSRYRDSSDQRRVQPADTMFSKGIRLDGFILPGPKVKAGESILLKLLWNVSKIDSEYGPLAIGIHFMDGQGCTVFQGDYGLAEALTVGSNPRTFGTDDFFRILVPPSVAPGEYRVRVGLWIPRLRQRLRVESSLLPFKKREVELAAVTVE